jgi:septum formation protein
VIRIDARLDKLAPLVLGSGSPRRREILQRLAIPFVVRVGDADEDVRAGEAVDAYLPRVVRAKLAAVRRAIANDAETERAVAILVADTSVVLDGAILGKPADVDEAYAMIARLSGRTHEVHTRFAFAATRGDSEPWHEETVATRVTFRTVSEREARAHAATGEGMDKAGGYAVQGHASAFVARIDGSYGAIVGLPACEMVVAMDKLGLVFGPPLGLV